MFTVCLLLIAYCLLPLKAHALTPTPTVKTTPTPTTATSKVTPTPTKAAPLQNIDNQINDLKERIASRVAQLKLVEKKGIIGTVTDVSGTQITVSDLNNETRFIDVDEITKFSSPSAKDSFGLSDITKGSKVGILGLFNKQSRRIMARFVDVMVTPVVVRGAVVAVDPTEFTILLQQEDGQKLNIDVETVTKTLGYTKEGGLAKSGFSKVKEGMRILVVGFPNIKDRKRIIGSRVIIFPDLPKNPRIELVQQAMSPQETIVPSTGSGKKLTPITR